jgi:hypothetical protein
LLDFLLDRKPFSRDVAVFLNHLSNSDLVLDVASISLQNINYIMAKAKNRKSAHLKISKINSLVNVLNVGQKEIHPIYLNLKILKMDSKISVPQKIIIASLLLAM